MSDELTNGVNGNSPSVGVDGLHGNGANGRGPNGVHTNGAFGLVRPADIVAEMQGAYLDYAMSVIVARALPDVRDGLKPVHRRILYAIHHDLGLDHTKPHKKSARIVGEVLGKYHPHGDTAVYDAMVRMAQPFSLRYPLIDGQGNFGSVDGDNAAAMRYTEARLAEISQLMLADLEKDTIDWHDNFDNSLREPDILPAALPNLLINGSSGIAVGMATNIPPHNLGEVVDALVYLIDRYDQVETITVEELMQFVKGPDFPTGGILYRYRDEKGDDNVDAIAQGYSVGRARLVMQAKAHFEEMSRSRSRIVITELPYQTNKVALIERIAGLVRDGKLEGITDLRDESDRTGMRVVIELTRNVEPKDILADLFKQTPLQQTFGLQTLALVDGEPRTLSLKRMLHLFVQHRQEIIRRRSEYDLKRAKERAHILEGLLRALDILDEVIHTIRHSQSAETARTNLVRNFDFSEIQAQAILDMQLRRLAALERRKLQDEYKELKKHIAYLEDLLAHPEKILGVIKTDLLEIKEKYADARRTQIVDRTQGTLTTTDLLPDQEVWVAVSAGGELRRQETSRLSAAALRQVGKGSEVELITANTRDFLYLFARDGRCRRVAIHEIPQSGAEKHLAEMTDFTRRDAITAALAFPRSGVGDGYLVLVTEQGMVKRVTLADFMAASASPELSVMNVEDRDRLRWVLRSPGEQEIILVSASGQSIRFGEDDVRSMGLAAGGVGGMKLKQGDSVVYAARVDPAGELLTITAQGYAKRTPIEEYSRQGRNGGGIVTHKPTTRTGPVAAALMLGATPPDQLLVLPRKGAVKSLALADVPSMGRGVQGKQVVELGDGNSVAALRMAHSAYTATADPVTLAEEEVPAKARASSAPVRSAPAVKPAATPLPIKSAPKPAAAPAEETTPARAPRTRATATELVPPKPDGTPSRTKTAKSAAAKSTAAPAAEAAPPRPARTRAATAERVRPEPQPEKVATPARSRGPAKQMLASDGGSIPARPAPTQEAAAPVTSGKRRAAKAEPAEAKPRREAKQVAAPAKAAETRAPAKRKSQPAAPEPAQPQQPSLLPDDSTGDKRRRKLDAVTSVKRPRK